MSAPKKKRTSRKVPQVKPAGVSGQGKVEAAQGAKLDHVIVDKRTLMHVDAGADVSYWWDKWSRHGSPLSGLSVRIHADAKINGIDVTYGGDANGGDEDSTIVVHARAKLSGVVMNLYGGETDIFEDAQVGDGKNKVTLRGPVSIGAGATVLGNSEIWATAIGARTTINNCRFHPGSRIGGDCSITNTSPGAEIHVGFGTVIEGRGPRHENFTFAPAGIGMRCRIGLAVDLHTDVLISSDVVIGDYATVRNGAKIGNHVKIADGDEDDYVEIGRRTVVDHSVKIGANTEIHDEVKIGAGVSIGFDVTIEKYAIIDPGLSIGNNAVIKSGVRVRKNVAAGEVVETAAGALEPVTVHATAESWMLGRVADVMEAAGQKRLDKRVLAKELPTLVETHCVKQLLRMVPPPDVATLRQMAEQFACTPKYVGEPRKVPPYIATVKPRGWSGMQVMGDYDNDVIIFRTTPEVLDSVVPGWIASYTAVDGDPHPWQVGFLNSLMILGKTGSHPGGEDPYVIGWARVKFNEEESAVLCEELQTDMALLSWDPSSEVWYLADSTSTRSTHGFVISQAIATLLTTEGIVPSMWERYVREKMQRGEIRGEPGRRRVIMPTFTKDKAAQQKAMMALVFWNAGDKGPSRRGGTPLWHPDDLYGGFEGFSDSARVYRWVAVDLLSEWGQFAIEHPMTSVLHDPKIAPAIERVMREWPVEAAKIIEDVRGLFGDFYESALAGVLQLARKAGMKEVWVPDYETKYAIAAYGGSETSAPLEPPRSVYTELPKKFGVTQVERLPEYMDTTVWSAEAAERRVEKWPRVQIPDEPRGRRLLTNSKVRR
jgi:UDP-3-O-[3-hydroxymyristoyl] glucosamine N-acyltransferase